jgi:hypothetical protein
MIAAISIGDVITLLCAVLAIGVFVGQSQALKVAIDHLTEAIEKMSGVLNDHETRLAVMESRLERERERRAVM